MSNAELTPDPRAEQLRNDPVAYLRAARERRLAEVKRAERREQELRRRAAARGR